MSIFIDIAVESKSYLDPMASVIISSTCPSRGVPGPYSDIAGYGRVNCLDLSDWSFEATGGCFRLHESFPARARALSLIVIGSRPVIVLFRGYYKGGPRRYGGISNDI